SVNAGNFSTGGRVAMVLDNDSGGMIGGNATLSLSASNILSGATNRSMLAEIENFGGGTINKDAAITVTAADAFSHRSLLVGIFNQGGSIGGKASIDFNITGTLTTQIDANFQILNSGGTIGSDA